jgi:undecaprenyl-diphosphatase
MEMLYSIDLMLFRCINGSLNNWLFDVFFTFITEIKYFYPIYAVALAGLIYFRRREGLVVVLLMILTIVISDQISSSLIKPLVGRIRPCSALEGVRLLVGCGGGKSFPSSHAVNNFAGVFVLSSFFPRQAPWLYVFACLVALSRVYVGVHYPSDIYAGAVIGTSIGVLVMAIHRKIAVFVENKRKMNMRQAGSQT